MVYRQQVKELPQESQKFFDALNNEILHSQVSSLAEIKQLLADTQDQNKKMDSVLKSVRIPVIGPEV